MFEFKQTFEVSGTHVHAPSARRRLYICWIGDLSEGKRSVDLCQDFSVFLCLCAAVAVLARWRWVIILKVATGGVGVGVERGVEEGEAAMVGVLV